MERDDNDLKVWSIRKKIEGMLDEPVENSLDIYISHKELFALMIIGGYYKKSFVGDHDNVTTVGNLMCIGYEDALKLCKSIQSIKSYGLDNILMIVESSNKSSYIKFKEELNLKCPLKLTDVAVSLVNEFISEGSLEKFRKSVFKAIDKGVYPGNYGVGVPWTEDNVNKVASTVNDPIWAQLLEIPCVDLIYKECIDSYIPTIYTMCKHDKVEEGEENPKYSSHYELDFTPHKDMFGGKIEFKDRSRELARIVLAKLLDKPVCEEDVTYLYRMEFDCGIVVNGVRITFGNGGKVL